MPFSSLRRVVVLAFCFVAFVSGTAKESEPSPPDRSAQAGGIYALEGTLAFNSLDGAFFDSHTGRITLFGHRDPRYRGTVPYLQHLSVLLEESRPAFSLEWTPETRAKVNQFMHSSDWAYIFDHHGQVTRVGAYVLPLLGIYPTRNKSAPGFLGLGMEAGSDAKTIRITAVEPGSPAAAAGMQAGEIITSVPDAPLLEPAIVERSLRFAGAGSTFILCVQGKPDCYRPVLAATTGEAWTGIGGEDVAAAVLRTAGNQNAARAADALAVWQRASDTEAGVHGVYQVLGDNAEREKIEADVTAGKLDHEAGRQRMLRRLCERLDDFLAAHGEMIRTFDARLATEGHPGAALSACLNSAVPAVHQLKNNAMRQFTAKPGGIALPPAFVETISGFHFDVVLKFIRLNQNSLLARVMEESDYQAKSILEREELSKKFPRYQTEAAYEATHPSTAPRNADERVWITPHYVDAAQSFDGSTLLIRRMKMRFNIRGIGANRKDLAAVRGGYQDLLTSLYDDLATEYPVLYELKEASKLSLVAEWILAHNPNFRLPQEGRTQWAPPQKLPGLVFVSLQAKPSPGTLFLQNNYIRPSGGVALSPFPEGNSDMRLQDIVGTDPSIQPFPAHGASTASAPGGVDPALLYSGIRQPIPVRPPQAAAWAGNGTVDGRRVSTISVSGSEQGGDQKAFALWKAGDINRAEQKYLELLQKTNDPQQKAGLKMMLFGVLEEKGDKNGALAAAADAHVLAPDNRAAYLIYIKALSDSGDVGGATAEMTKYVALDPNNQPARKVLADLRERQNHPPVSPFPSGAGAPLPLFGADEANSVMASEQFDELQRTHMARFHPSQRPEIDQQIRAEQVRRRVEVELQFKTETAGMSRPQATEWLQRQERELQTKSVDLKQQIELQPPGPQKETLQTQQQEVDQKKKTLEDISVEWNEEKPAQQSPTPAPTPGL